MPITPHNRNRIIPLYLNIGRIHILRHHLLINHLNPRKLIHTRRAFTPESELSGVQGFGFLGEMGIGDLYGLFGDRVGDLRDALKAVLTLLGFLNHGFCNVSVLDADFEGFGKGKDCWGAAIAEFRHIGDEGKCEGVLDAELGLETLGVAFSKDLMLG